MSQNYREKKVNKMYTREEIILFSALCIKDLEAQTNRLLPAEKSRIVFRYVDSSARQLLRGSTDSAKLFLLDATECLFGNTDINTKNGAMFVLNRYINILTSEYERRSVAA